MKVLQISWRIALTALVLSLAGCHSRQAPFSDHPRSFSGVSMQDVTFFSRALNGQMPYRVYLPKTDGNGPKLPVTYLLHGCGTGFTDWSNYSDVGAYAARGAIFVMVDGGCSYYMNAALMPKDRYEDYFVHDVIADVESRFPAAASRENRAVVGVSMGGFAAVKLALARPELFAFAGALSPAVDVPSRAFRWRRWSQSVRFRAIFGPAGTQTRLRNDPFVLVKKAAPAKTPYIYITAGEQEPLFDPIQRFAALLKQDGYAYEFHTQPGGHDWREWNAQLPGCFESLLAHVSPAQPQM